MESGEENPLGFGSQPKLTTIRVERATAIQMRGDSDFVIAIQDHLSQGAVVVPIGNFESVMTVKNATEHCDGSPRHDASQARNLRNFFQMHDLPPMTLPR